MSHRRHKYQRRREIIAKLKAKQEAEIRREEAIEGVKQELEVVRGKVKAVSQTTLVAAKNTNHLISALLSQISRLKLAANLKALRPDLTLLKGSKGLNNLLFSVFLFIAKTAYLINKKISPYLWRYHYAAIGGALVLGLGFNVWQQYNRFPHHPLKPAFQQLNSFPSLPFATLYVADKSFASGYSQTAFQYFEIAKIQQQNLEKMGLSFLTRRYYEQVKLNLEAPQRWKIEKQRIEEQLKQTPFSWELLLAKAKLEAELGETESLETTLNLLTWLKPEFDVSLLTSPDTLSSSKR